jgi:hypothetical protein
MTMGATEVVGVVLGIIKGLIDLIAQIKTEGTKTPEEVQALIHGLADDQLKPWLPEAVKPADDTFNSPK